MYKLRSSVLGIILGLLVSLAHTFLVCPVSAQLQSNRGTDLVTPSAGKYAGQLFYTDSHALIIGINQYPKLNNSNLHYAVQDAKDLRDMLVRSYGFAAQNIKLLLDDDATKKAIEDALGDLADGTRVKETDRVLVFFAGHGQTVKLTGGGDMGFLLPSDADADLAHPENRSGYLKTCIDMKSVWAKLEACSARHRLLIADACFGGLLAHTRAPSVEEPNSLVIKQQLETPAMQVITGGSAGQTTTEDAQWGHGAFTFKLLEKLRIHATIENDVFLASELGEELKTSVGNLTAGRQSPQVEHYGGTEGNFIFVTTKPVVEEIATIAGAGYNEIVGTCNEHKVTWGDLVTTMKLMNPELWKQSVESVTSRKRAVGWAATSTFSTMTEVQAADELRQHPTQELSGWLNGLLARLAVDDEATKLNVRPTESDTNTRIAAIIQMEREYHLLSAEVEEQISKVMDSEQTKTISRFIVQSLSIFEKNDLAATLGYMPGPVDIMLTNEILIKPKDLPESASEAEQQRADETAFKRASQILSDIRTGKITFTEAARTYNDDADSKNRGGKNLYLRGVSDDEIDKTVFAAKLNDVTGPVKADGGYYIIMVTKTGEQITPAEARVIIDIYAMGQTIRDDRFLNRIIGLNKVENKLSKLVPQTPVPENLKK